MDSKAVVVSLLVFVGKFLFLFGGGYFFIVGIFDILHAIYMAGFLQLLFGALAIRIGIFLFSLDV